MSSQKTMILIIRLHLCRLCSVLHTGPVILSPEPSSSAIKLESKHCICLISLFSPRAASLRLCVGRSGARGRSPAGAQMKRRTCLWLWGRMEGDNISILLHVLFTEISELLVFKDTNCCNESKCPLGFEISRLRLIFVLQHF